MSRISVCVFYLLNSNKNQQTGGANAAAEKHPCCPGGAAAAILPAKDVLRAMCDCIFASTKYGDAAVRRAICGIVLQRVVGMTNLSREDQRIAAEYCEEAAKQWQLKLRS